MTVPMVGVDALPRPRSAASNEMAASMFIPSFAVIGLLAAGAVTDIGVLMIIEHVAMLLGDVGGDAAAPR